MVREREFRVAVRARENGVPLVAANKVGVEARSVAYCGKSQIVAADGSIVALASQDEETTVHGTIAIGPVALPSSATVRATMLLGAMATTTPLGRVCSIHG